MLFSLEVFGKKESLEARIQCVLNSEWFQDAPCNAIYHSHKKEMVFHDGSKTRFALINTLEDAYCFAGHEFHTLIIHADGVEKAAWEYLQALVRRAR